MGRKKKKLVYLALLVSAAGAFIVDRLFLGAPEPAAGAPARAAGRPGRPARPKPSAREKSAGAVDPSLAWLDRLGGQKGRRNIFAPSLDMLAYYKMLQGTDPEAEEAENDAGDDSPAAFEEAHQLQGTCISDDALMAVVNGRVVRLGDEIDGYRLTKIEPYRAEFRRGRHRASLSIPLPAAVE